MAGLGSAPQVKGVARRQGRRLALGVATFRPFRAASAAEKVATFIDSIAFVRPVTPNVAGSSPLAPDISINDLARASYSDYNFLAAQSCKRPRQLAGADSFSAPGRSTALADAGDSSPKRNAASTATTKQSSMRRSCSRVQPPCD